MMTSHFIPKLTLLCLLLALMPFLMAWPAAANPDLEIKASPAESGPLVFGKTTNIMLSIRNISPRVIIVSGIGPQAGGLKGIGLSSAAHGSAGKISDADEYRVNWLAQQMTWKAFSTGLLLPDETLTTTLRYKPISLFDKFKTWYYKADVDYAGSHESMKPFSIYIPMNSEYLTNGRYVPFTHERWKEIVLEYRSRDLDEIRMNPRAVLVEEWGPESYKKVLVEEIQVEFQYEGDPLLLEEAIERISTISHDKNSSRTVDYCEALGGFVVIENDGAWLFTARDQTQKSNMLPKFPRNLVFDMNLRGHILVRVGDEQVGFGSGLKPTSKTFWNKFPVYYGDGKYTQGEFLDLGENDLLPFLQMARQKGMNVAARPYYISSRYYVLELSQ